MDHRVLELSASLVAKAVPWNTPWGHSVNRYPWDKTLRVHQSAVAVVAVRISDFGRNLAVVSGLVRFAAAQSAMR